MATQDVDSDYDDDEAPSDLSTTLRIEYVDASKAEGPVVAFERDLPGEDGPWEFTLGRNADAGPQRINDVAIQPDSVGRSHALLKIAADADGGYRTTISHKRAPLALQENASNWWLIAEMAWGPLKLSLSLSLGIVLCLKGIGKVGLWYLKRDPDYRDPDDDSDAEPAPAAHALRGATQPDGSILYKDDGDASMREQP